MRGARAGVYFLEKRENIFKNLWHILEVYDIIGNG
jgi:hypothetical protein